MFYSRDNGFMRGTRALSSYAGHFPTYTVKPCRCCVYFFWATKKSFMTIQKVGSNIRVRIVTARGSQIVQEHGHGGRYAAENLHQLKEMERRESGFYSKMHSVTCKTFTDQPRWITHTVPDLAFRI